MYAFKVVKGINGNTDFVCLLTPDVTDMWCRGATSNEQRDGKGSGRAGIGEHRYEERGGGGR